MERIGKRDSHEHFERREILEKVYNNYLDIVADDTTNRFVFLNADDAPEELANKAAKIIRDALAERTQSVNL